MKIRFSDEKEIIKDLFQALNYLEKNLTSVRDSAQEIEAFIFNLRKKWGDC